MSSLAVLSKLVERLVSSQLRSYRHANKLFLSFQSACRPHHSTETVIHEIISDIFLSMNKDNVCLLCSLDLSAAFDTVDHSILCAKLSTSFSFCDTVLKWLLSFLRDIDLSVLRLIDLPQEL